MIIYPAGETETERHEQPLVSLVFVAASIAGLLWLVAPVEDAFLEDRARAEETFWAVLDAERERGRLAHGFWLEAHESPAVVSLPENRDVFPERVRSAYRHMIGIDPALSRLAEGGLSRLSLLISPASLWLLILGAVCLWWMGYLVEHLISRLVVAALFFTSGFIWVMAADRVPAAYWPPVELTWSWGVLTFLLAGWLVAPAAKIEVLVRGWLVRPFRLPVMVPAALIPLIFAAVAIGFCLLGPHASGLTLSDGIALAVVPSILGLAIIFTVPRRQGQETSDPDSLINQQLTAAEIMYGDEHYEEGTHLLGSLLDHDPDTDQLRRMISLAWQQDETELVHDCYHRLFRRAVTSGDFYRILEIVEEMVNRQVPVPSRALIQLATGCIRQDQLDHAFRLLPHLEEGNREDVVRVLESLGRKLSARTNPSTEMMMSLHERLRRLAPDNPMVAEMDRLFEARASRPSELEVGHTSVHKVVEIQLHEIGISNLDLTVGSKRQRVPWTAVLGIFGCHMTGEHRGWRGCVVVKFQRRIFACVFQKENLAVHDGLGRKLSFEEVWGILSEQIPEDLPFLAMKHFPQIATETMFADKLDAFLRADRLQSEPMI